MEALVKILAETKGSFQLLEPMSGELLPFNRPAVVFSTSFFQTRIARGDVTVHAELKDEATDAEFAKYWAEAQDIAIASFKSRYAVDAVETKVAPPPPAEGEVAPVTTPPAPAAEHAEPPKPRKGGKAK
jgi:hypothetical protein